MSIFRFYGPHFAIKYGISAQRSGVEPYENWNFWNIVARTGMAYRLCIFYEIFRTFEELHGGFMNIDLYSSHAGTAHRLTTAVE